MCLWHSVPSYGMFMLRRHDVIGIMQKNEGSFSDPTCASHLQKTCHTRWPHCVWQVFFFFFLC